MENNCFDNTFLDQVKHYVNSEFENPEVRVRLVSFFFHFRVSICDVFEALARIEGVSIWEEFKEYLYYFR